MGKLGSLGVLLAVVSAGVTGCNQEPTPPHALPEGVSEPAPAAAPVEVAPQARLVDHEVTWPSETVAQKALEALPAAAREAVPRSRVPVLVIARPELLAATALIVKPRWTALHSRADGVTVNLQALRTARRYDHIPPARGTARVRGKDAWITQNEGIWSAAWEEGGVGYSLEVACDAAGDARCESSHYTETLAAELAYVGGEGAR
ncbi:MAG: hypothetical protein KC731_17450 [Myxococcales bacterium]|nr:hypothetical protein [Myxococcales bacterium]